ncbi:MAG: amidase [Saprospiraceae bacterium]|nr:amidase [Saprospiraceae bacterium]
MTPKLWMFVAALLAFSCQHRSDSSDLAEAAQALYGLTFSPGELDTLATYLDRNAAGYDSMRAVLLDERVLPAVQFNPLPLGFQPRVRSSSFSANGGSFNATFSLADLHRYSIAELGYFLRSGEVTAVELTRQYLDRLRHFDPVLKCTITILEEEALAKAAEVDQERAGGTDRGPLHGIPYGIKDLFSYPGYPTTWGAEPYQEQTFSYTATVISKLEEAGAILVAKLTSGALARGDVWFGGQTRNPWDTLQGASGSSAGSGSAVSARLVPFAIGTETLGSIVSPSNRNGVTGLRPSYGTVSRYGCMSLSWSMDKVGPLAGSALDCAYVYDAIRGKDHADPLSTDAPFYFPSEQDPRAMRVGVLSQDLGRDTSTAGDHMREIISRLELEGVIPIPVRLPETLPGQAFDVILRAEAGAFFDELVLSNGVDDMVQQGKRSRANSLRQSRFIPAVEYIQANRHRSQLIQNMHELMVNLDVLLAPTFGSQQLLITNLTGHPAVTLPTGLDSLRHPTSMTLLGNLYDEGRLLTFAQFIQGLTDFHKKMPPGFE